jgi:hypothetical protein
MKRVMNRLNPWPALVIVIPQPSQKLDLVQVLDRRISLRVYTLEPTPRARASKLRLGDVGEFVEMYKQRAYALAAPAVLIGVHGAILALRYGTETASLWGDWIDTAAPLTGAIICWMVSRQAGPFGKRVWRLFGFSFLLAGIGQGLYTDYYDYRHAPLGTLWPSDVLVFFWVVPAMMTLFLSPRDPERGFGWLRVCDFVQVSTLALAVELSQIYVPSRWQAAGQTMELRALHAGIFFFGAIALSFVLRGLLSLNRTERAFFLRVSVFLTVHAIVLNATLYYQASGHYRQGA